ncbi:MAG: prepilin-type N-terminal cleavage/methylation domain-containing protein [Phycisphaerales bacterium]|nr:prepilin-type N-terminal cleavage/methylation domain-containing protein [Phycisphaerales bacterium]
MTRLPRIQQRGFTLLEVMLTAILMMIAAAMVIPMFGTSDSAYVSAGAALMVSDLDFAQATAINEPTDDVAVHFDTANARWWITPASDPATPFTMTNGDPYDTTMGVGRADLAVDVAIAVSGMVADEFAYDAYGRLSQSTDAVITLSRGTSQTVITIDAELGFLTAQ